MSHLKICSQTEVSGPASEGTEDCKFLMGPWTSRCVLDLCLQGAGPSYKTVSAPAAEQDWTVCLRHGWASPALFLGEQNWYKRAWEWTMGQFSASTARAEVDASLSRAQVALTNARFLTDVVGDRIKAKRAVAESTGCFQACIQDSCLQVCQLGTVWSSK